VSFGSDSLPFATSFARSTGKCMSVEPDSLLALTFAETSRDLRPSVTQTTRSIAETAPSEISCNPYTSIFSSGTTQNPASKARSKKSCTGEPSFQSRESLHVKTQKRLGSDSSLPLSLPTSPRPLSLPPSDVRPFGSPKCRSRWYSSTPHISSIAHFVPQVRTALVPTPPHRSEHLETLSPRFSARRR
jgi:hypothetical protein